MAECWCRTPKTGGAEYMVCFSCFMQGARSVKPAPQGWWEARLFWERHVAAPPKKISRRLKKVALKKEARKLLESLKAQYPLLNHL